MALSRRHGATAVVLSLAVSMAACAPQPDPSPTATPSSVEDEGRTFYLAQGFAADEGRLTPKTPEQQLLVDEVIESGVWAGIPDEDVAWMSLELTIDVCLVAIESGHQVDAARVQEHIGSSDVLGSWERAFGDADPGLPFMLGGLAISGMKHLCPDDYPDWIAAYRELPIPTG
ncbi:hypothetical protein [Microbacterium sp. NPDC091662]|uniref:hypothetical protein n=1 Tax=Microbacterium sp. NPDC091662 TaxID=3364211 RepID=UPI00382061E6